MRHILINAAPWAMLISFALNIYLFVTNAWNRDRVNFWQERWRADIFEQRRSEAFKKINENKKGGKK